MKMDRVQSSVVNYFRSKYELPPEADPNKAAAGLQKAINKKHDNDELADCHECGGVGPTAEPVCSFCGIGDSEESTRAFALELSKVKASAKAAPMAKSAPAKAQPDRKRRSSGKPVASAPVEVVQSDATIEEHLARYNELKVEGSKNYWEMALVVSEINRTQSWRSILGDKDKPVFRSWNQFVKVQLGTSVMMANKMVDVAQNFGEKDFQLIGVSKLDLMLRLPPPKRAKLLSEMREKPVSRTELEKKLRELGATRKGAGATGNTREATQVTAVLPVTRQRVQLFAKGSDEKRAKTMKAAPHGELLANNGVHLRFELVEGKGGWELVVKAER